MFSARAVIKMNKPFFFKERNLNNLLSILFKNVLFIGPKSKSLRKKKFNPNKRPYTSDTSVEQNLCFNQLPVFSRLF